MNVAPAQNIKYVGFLRRLAATIIDGIILSIITGVASSVFGVIFGLLQIDILGNFLSLIINLIINFSYTLGFLVKKGATPGKMILGIKVVTLDGGSITLGRAALREIIGKFVSGLVFCLGYLWIIWDKKKQGWHDKIAGTVVIYTK